MTAVQPEVIGHLDFEPMCGDPKCGSTATHIAFCTPPCGCNYSALLCSPCAEKWRRYYDAFDNGARSIQCTQCGHVFKGSIWEYVRIEPLP